MNYLYITNDVNIAKICDINGVIPWIDLEYLGKEERQKGMNTVKSNHSIEDIRKIKPYLKNSKLLVRINPINLNSKEEIKDVIEAGADIIMLPMFKDEKDVKFFLDTVNNRCQTMLLFETKESVENVEQILNCGKIDYVHIGLNDLHLSYKLNFMFELLVNGKVDRLCETFKNSKIPYGFGGIAKIGYGDIPAEFILSKHIKLHSSQVILSRSFCNFDKYSSYTSFEKDFNNELCKLRKLEECLNFCGDVFINSIIEVTENKIIDKSKENVNV